MFSDNNYGLPKALIDAAKKVHENQLEEGAGKYAEPRMDPEIHEEELAEAFAIFLEENFHVDMLTEEDLDFVFEEEFPQWLEESWLKAGLKYFQQGAKAAKDERNMQKFLNRKLRTKSSLPSPSPKAGLVDVVKRGVKAATDERKMQKFLNNALRTKSSLPSPSPVSRSGKAGLAEEVEFTEEELAEAFAIFLEENFHVDMLTEEDLDFVFEEEFPQWLEENRIAPILRFFQQGAKNATDVVKRGVEAAKGERNMQKFLNRKLRTKSSLPSPKAGLVDVVKRGVEAAKGERNMQKFLNRKLRTKSSLPSGAKKSQAEEVEFTEEELAEAFAIFLEENFHVDMLTEEDLDIVFEEEFPQWLEEGWGKAVGRIFGYLPQGANKAATVAQRGANKAAAVAQRGANIVKKNPKTAAAAAVGATVAINGNTGGGNTPEKKHAMTGGLDDGNQIAKEKKHAMTGGLDDGNQIAKAPPVPSKQVRRSRPASTAKPAASVRKRTGGPSLYQKSKRAVRSTPGDPGRTATDRLKYMAARGNRASQKALRGPKKNWRSSVFEPQN